MKISLAQVKKGTVITLAVLGVASIITTFVRYRLVKRMLEKEKAEADANLSE